MTGSYYLNYLIFYQYCDAMVKNAFNQYDNKDMRKLCLASVETELGVAFDMPEEPSVPSSIDDE